MRVLRSTHAKPHRVRLPVLDLCRALGCLTPTGRADQRRQREDRPLGTNNRFKQPSILSFC